MSLSYEKSKDREIKFFDELLDSCQLFIREIQNNSVLIAQLDCLASFSNLSISQNYVRPEIDDSFDIEIINSKDTLKREKYVKYLFQKLQTPYSEKIVPWYAYHSSKDNLQLYRLQDPSTPYKKVKVLKNIYMLGHYL